MPTGYLQVPDWFSSENQGGGVAVADLGGTGAQDLIVLMVDNPPGQNSGFYRVGRNMDAAGNPTGGWTPWTAVPDWFPWENQGAGVAVADLDKDGKQELVVFMIDDPPGKNQGYYRVGKGLDVNGIVTGGWQPWIPIPDWFSWENEYGSIELADLDGDGNLELIVLMVDHPGGQPNRGVYRIGRNLDLNGVVTGGWTPWIDVPGWFSWDNQGAGIGIADLTNAGQHDLIVFQIDNPVEQNQAFYKIGSQIDINGNVAGGWIPAPLPGGAPGIGWLGVPAWFAWENQGGGIATFDSADAGSLRWVNLIRNCVTTHSFDGSQRLVDLGIVSQANGVVQVSVPTNRNIAPPGWYMLFLVNNNGVPSVARWIHLS